MIKTAKIISIFYVVIYLSAFIMYKSDVISELFLFSAIYAGVLNLLNSLAAFFLFKYSFGKSNNIFLIANLGGMGVRLLFLLIAVFIFIKFLNIDKYGFILTFFIFYFFLLIFEIYYFKNKVEKKGIN